MTLRLNNVLTSVSTFISKVDTARAELLSASVGKFMNSGALLIPHGVLDDVMFASLKSALHLDAIMFMEQMSCNDVYSGFVFRAMACVYVHRKFAEQESRVTAIGHVLEFARLSGCSCMMENAYNHIAISSNGKVCLTELRPRLKVTHKGIRIK